MVLLHVQGKLTNLNIKERLALGISLRMFTRSIVIKKRVEDLNWASKVTKRSSTSQSRIRTHQISNERKHIKQNKDKKNRLMHIDELYKFSDGTLNDVRSAFDDILKRIRMKYLPQTVWRNVDSERAGAMI
ncbi:hypothetical protein Tco_1021848 [Tanacetum coccineum]